VITATVVKNSRGGKAGLDDREGTKEEGAKINVSSLLSQKTDDGLFQVAWEGTRKGETGGYQGHRERRKKEKPIAIATSEKGKGSFEGFADRQSGRGT